MARLEFSGARYVRNYHLAVPHHELDLDKKKSLLPSPGTPGEGQGVRAPSLDDNLIIHGDNLKALKALLPHYAALNKEDGGNRKFILVEQEDYADNITAERVRRVIKGVPSPLPLSRSTGRGVQSGLGGSFTYATLGTEYDVAKILSGKNLPKYEDMAAYVFQTATGETLDPKKIEKKKHFIGSSKFYDVYLFYEPNVDKLKSAECALKLDFVESFSKITTPTPPSKGGAIRKKRLIFGAVRYVNQETMMDYGMEFCQLPYEVYRRIEDGA